MEETGEGCGFFCFLELPYLDILLAIVGYYIRLTKLSFRFFKSK